MFLYLIYFIQEAIKEKEVHIEQLLKEKDLERADLARAVARAEEVNHNYLQTLTKLEKVHTYPTHPLVPSPRYVSTKFSLFCVYVQSEVLLAQAQKQIEALRRDLDDERRKNEDLEFRIEEQSLIMEDFKVHFTSFAICF